MNIDTSEIKNLTQETVDNFRKRDKCLDKCNTEEFNELDSRIKEKFQTKSIDERVGYLSFIVEELENIKNNKDICHELQMETIALERIGALIWVCTYEDIYDMVELDYIRPEMKKLTHTELLEEYAIENFKHNYKLYMLIANAAQDFNFTKDEKCITSKIKTIDAIEDEFLENIIKYSAMEVRQYIKDKKVKKIAEAILDTRIAKYWVDTEKDNQPTPENVEKKLILIYDSILNKNQTVSVQSTIKTLFNKTKEKDQIEDMDQLRSYINRFIV